MESEIQNLYKPATRCRIYAWQFEQLYLGAIPEFGVVLYSVPVLRISLSGAFKVRIKSEEWQSCSCIYIPAGIAHEVQPTVGIIAKYWVEKESRYTPYLKENLFVKRSEQEYLTSSKKIITAFRQIYDSTLSLNQAKKVLDSLFIMAGNPESLIDARILSISKIIRNEPDYNFSIESLATEVDLSPSRLLHLIKEETGSSYRKFRMWQRVRYAISIFASRHSLTYASVEAGFNDSAHFCRCFKSIYGVNPSSVHKTLEVYEIQKW
jgi:AraC-like DNA-binding protein